MKRAKKRNWRKKLNKCPFFLSVVATSCVAMVFSNEIGVRAAWRELTSADEMFAAWSEAGGQDREDGFGVEAVQESSADGVSMPETGTDGTPIQNADENDTTPRNDVGLGETESGQGKETEDPVETESGKVQEDEGNLQDGAAEELNQDINNNMSYAERIAQNGENEAKGVTKYKYYTPQKVDSIYYTDAGKIALTTEYPYETVDESYFDDAAFIGDSRTLGLSDYIGFDQADFYCENSMTIFKLLEDEGIKYQKTGDNVDLKEVLQQKKYGKIYIMLGINEYGYGNTDMWADKYRETVERIRQWQPEAIIYIMANLHISKEKDEDDKEVDFNNLNINDKNAASASLANGTDIFYLDVNPLFTDDDGYLNSDLTFDGVHLYAQHYDVWRQFLMEHAVVKEDP